MFIGLDYDDTCVLSGDHYPKINGPVPGAIEVLKELIKNDHKLILWTVRDGKALTDAISWFKDNKIRLYGINENPSQSKWNKSRKVYADIYIDNLNLGCPLIKDLKLSHKEFVDWAEIKKLLKKQGLL